MRITVFCGSRNGKGTDYMEAARRVGNWIGSNGNTLVYGGGNAGLMGILSETAFKAGAEVIGVVPENISVISNRPQTYTTQLIKAKDMSERKHQMEQLADAFIALPGGQGTLDEITEVFTLTNLSILNKPAILLNVNNYYQPLKQLLDNMIENGFLTEKEIEKVLFSDNLEEIEEFIKNNI